MKELTRIIEDGLKRRIYSAIAVEVIKKNDIVLSITKGTDRLQGEPAKEAEQISSQHWFDLASLTKPLCTALLSSILIENNSLSYDTRAEDIYSEYAISINPALKDITIGNLLDHSSGLEAWFPIYKTVSSRSDAYMFLRSRTPNYVSGEKHVYSDVGYMMLGEILEVLFQKRLDYIFEHYISQPLELRDLDFMPISKEGAKDELKFVSTGHSNIRDRELFGEVNDENSFILDGVSGHAGLFGTLSDTSRLASHIFNIIKGREENDHIRQGTLTKMIERKDNSEWVSGWHYPSPKNSSSGSLMSKNSIGMTGFTGTSIWMDLDNDIIVTVLSNRTISPDSAKFGGESDGFTKLRPIIHDAIMGELL